MNWPHQDDSVHRIGQARARGIGRVLLTIPTGGGKTRVATILAQNEIEGGGKVSLYTNRKMLIEQTSKVFAKAGLEHGVRAADYANWQELGLQISSIQTESSRVLKRQTWQLHEATLVLVDECFVSGTLISTPRGEVPIDKVRCGDTVYCATGIGTVRAVSCRPSPEIVQVRLSNGRSLRCTPSHPFFTGSGWKNAGALAVGEVTYGIQDVCWLWESVRPEAVDKKRGGKRVGRKRMDCPNKLLAILCEEGQEPDECSGVGSEDAKTTKGNKTSPYSAWRERAIASLAAVGNSSRLGLRVGIRIPDTNKKAERERVSDRLQSGHRKSRTKDRDRVGRELAPTHFETGSGREKNDLIGGVRVESVSHIEREGITPVFNLHVDGHPSYFANGILVHNCHLQRADTAKELFRRHREQGAFIVGLTATPLDLAEMYDELVVGATVSELRKCGALVLAHHYGPDEPDLRHVGKIASGVDLSEKENAKAIMTPTIFARVIESWRTLNPEQKPSILFAPGVAESVWFAEQFHAAGVSAAHIDGEDVWLDGELHRSSPELRQEILDRSKDGRIKIVCNRFVLREGVDCPWLTHGILATVLGSLQSYLQVGGRLLRACEGKTHCVIQDHGGNWHRHGSLNADREWSLEYTAGIVSGLRTERMRAKKESEPARCPACARIITGTKCPCGHEIKIGRKSRPVIQSDGTLKEMQGDIYRPHRIAKNPDLEEVWERMYHRSRKGRGEKTFRAAMALFAYENNWQWPDPAWRFMPLSELDQFRMVGDVPKERLR